MNFQQSMENKEHLQTNLIQGRCKISANWVPLSWLAFEPQSNIKTYISTPSCSGLAVKWQREKKKLISQYCNSQVKKTCEPQGLKYQAFVIYTHPLLRKKDVYITKPFECFIEQHIVSCVFLTMVRFVATVITPSMHIWMHAVKIECLSKLHHSVRSSLS